MSPPRYQTIGAVAPDERSLKGIADRLDSSGVALESVVVLARRRDLRLARALLPDAEVRGIEGGLTKRQWFEFASTFFSASTVSFLMGVVHLWTGLVVQALLVVASAVGLVLYHRRPHVKRQLLRLGLPDKLAHEWEASLPGGFALILATAPREDFDEAEEAFLQDDALLSPLTVDRRPVL